MQIYNTKYTLIAEGKVFRENGLEKKTRVRRKDGYVLIDLTINYKVKTFYLHRLIAEHFIPNPCNFPQINHIDGNKLNNHKDNLEWCNNSHNVKHSYRVNKRPLSKSIFIKGDSRIKPRIKGYKVKG